MKLDKYRNRTAPTNPQLMAHLLTLSQIGPDNDPQDTHNENFVRPSSPSDRLPPHPLHTHSPWGSPVPDPDDGDISQVEWHGPNGMHFSRISFRSSTPMARRPAPTTASDLFGEMFNTIINGPAAATRNNDNDRRSGPPPRAGFTFETVPRSPLQEGPPRQAFGTYTTNVRLGPGGANGGPQPLPMDDLHGILSNLIASMQHGPLESNGESREGQPPPPFGGPLSFLHQLFNPANARAGDAVFTQEALDRVISHLMEQHSTSSAPGPASATAIAALPKLKLGKEHLDAQGKAECSICMDSLELGAEVTELPCKHWFHGECVGAWLGEHDTCPQCRRGIMPKEGDGSQPRTPGQVPRHMQAPWAMGRTNSSSAEGSGGGNAGGGESRQPTWSPQAGPRSPHTPTREPQWRGLPGEYPGSGSRQNPFHVPESPMQGSSYPQRPSGSRRHSSRDQSGGSGNGGNGSSGGGGIAGWFGRHFGGEGSNR